MEEVSDSRKASLEKILRRASQDQQITTSRHAVVLIAPPLTKEAFQAHAIPKLWVTKIFSRPREFIKVQFPFDTPESYEEKYAAPILGELKSLKDKTEVSIILDASFDCFRKEIHSPYRHSFFLLAHHMEDVRRFKWGSHKEKAGIEFSDGGRPWTEIRKMLGKANRENAPTWIALICNAEEPGRHLHEDGEIIGGIGYVPWPLPFVGAVRFTRVWLECLDSTKNLWNAYSLALDRIKNGDW